MNYRPSQSPVAAEAFPFALILVVITFTSFALGWQVLGVIGFFLFVYVLVFFRNPERYSTRKPAAVISGADGKIVATGIVPHPDFADGQCLRIAIFMSVFDCHINWSPVAGVVTGAQYFPGKFINAMEDKCGDENERKVITMRTAEGHVVVVKLVAGLIARRIVCPIDIGDELGRAEKIGLIRFGSRVEVFVPANSDLHVQPGMMVRGGETVIATLPAANDQGYSELRTSDQQLAQDEARVP